MSEQRFITPVKYKESTDDSERVFKHTYFADNTSVTELVTDEGEATFLSIIDRGSDHLIEPGWGRYPYSSRVILAAARKMLEEYR